MAVPARPASGAPIDSQWGGIAHDTAVAQDIQAGTASVVVSNAPSGSIAVTFPRPFAAPPTVVVAQNANTAGWFAYIGGVTATGFLAQVTTKAGNSATGTIPVTWVAIGPRA